jgi:hypothetical protein
MRTLESFRMRLAVIAFPHACARCDRLTQTHSWHRHPLKHKKPKPPFLEDIACAEPETQAIQSRV